MDDAMENDRQASDGKSFWSGKMAAFLMLLLFASVPLAPLAMTRGRAEWILWQTASALNQFENGERDAGLDRLKTLAALQPEDFQVQQRLAESLIETRQYDQAVQVARQLFNRVATQINEKQIHPVVLRPASSLYARCLVADGKPARALAVLQQTREVLKTSGTLQDLDFQYVLEMSNEIAYHAAIAGEQLDLASAMMMELFAARQSKIPFASSYSVSIDHQVIICTALVSIEQGTQDDMVELLDQELAMVEIAAGEIRKSILANYYRWMTEFMAGNRGGEPETLSALRNALGSIHLETALLLAVRSLALEVHDLEEMRQQAVRDRFRIADLGYDAGSLLKLLPDIRQSMVESLEGSMLLDTSGLVQLKQGKLELAMRSLDLACIANDMAADAMNGSLGEHPQEMHEPAMAKRLRDRMTAVLHLHRGQCHLALGNENLAASDFEQVRKLGFDRDDPDLF